jgi:DNA-binding NarL/FixJ family response regulator
LHATQEAASRREPLVSAVKQFGRARGVLRRLDHEEAIAAWTAMVEGRWTLVDHLDRDGKRAILAHRNVPPVNIAALRGDEARVATLAAFGHSNKYIAYELGFAASTTAALLRRALIKLGLRDRRELVRVLGPLAKIDPAVKP